MPKNLLERFEYLSDYRPDKLNESELLEENLKSFVFGLISLFSTPTLAQNVIEKAQNVVNQQQPVTINGKHYDSPEEFNELKNGLNTLNQFINDADVQRFISSVDSGNVDMNNVPAEVRDFYQQQNTDPATRQILNLASQLSKGAEYKSGGNKYEITDIKLKEIESKSGVNLTSLLQKDYDITNVEYKTIIDTIAKFAPDTLVTEFKLGNQQLFREDDYRIMEGSAVNQIVDSLKTLSKDKLISEVVVVGSASNIPTHLFGGSNQQLAQARACAITDKLEESGIQPSLISTEALVQGAAWNPNVSREERASIYHPNQYVEIKVFYVTKETSTPAAAKTEPSMQLAKLYPIKTGGGTSKGSGGGGGKTKHISAKGQNKCPKF